MTQAQIKNLFALDCQVKLYIPGTTEVNKPAPELQALYTNKALELFSELFGGATSCRHTGAWMSAQGLVKEDVNIVYSFCTGEQFNEGLERIYHLGLDICKTMTQEAVSLEFNNKLGFISLTNE